MKKLLLFFLIFTAISSQAQRVVSEDCIGTTNSERIFATHENDDSTVTFLYRRDGYFYSDSMSQAGHKIILLKLDKNKTILFQKELDSTYYNFLENDSYYFEKDGSFLLVAFNVFPSALYSTIAEKYDRYGNQIWRSENLYPSLYYADKHAIVKNQNGGYLIHTSNGETKGIVSLSESGQIKWTKEISTSDMLPVNSYGSYSNIDILPKRNNKTFISNITNRYDWMGGSVIVFAYNLILDSLGNTIADDTIIGANGFYFYLGIKYMTTDESYILSPFTDSNTLKINTDNLTVSNYDNPLGYPLNTQNPFLANANVQQPGANIFYYKSATSLVPDRVTINCTDPNNVLLWSYTFTDSVQINNNNSGLVIIDDSTLFIYNTLIRNGRKIWELHLHNQTDTLLYKGNYYRYTNYSGNPVNNSFPKISVSRDDHNNINIYSIYTYDYCPTFCDYIDLYRLQVIDINTGNISQEYLIDRKIGSISYLKSTGHNKAFLVSTDYSICHLGQSDVYLAEYSNEYNSIKGIAYIDYNNNNEKENNEPVYPYGYVTTAAAIDTQTQHLSSSHPFIFYVNTGSYKTILHLYNNYFTITPPQFITSHNNYGNNDTLLFALHPISTINDISIQLINNWMTRLGQNNAYTVSVENKGTAMANGKVKVLMDARLLNITSSPNYAYRNGDTIVWNIGNLAPLQKGQAVISFTAETPTTLNAGDTLISKVWYESDSTDITPADNYTELKETIRASYDPNDKAITSGETLTPQQVSNGSYISYIIHFQNKGNDTAFKVVVLDTLSEHADVSSLQIINASHAYTLEIIGKRILKFTFENIRLSYDTTNISSTGYIAYKLKPNTNVSLESTIDNTAHIYFDYNDPIKTNTVQTKIMLLSALHSTKNQSGIMNIFPNPNNGVFTIRFESKNNSTVQLQMTDITGNIIYNESRQHRDKTEFSIDENNLAKGIYWIKLTDGKDSYSCAVIVQ